MSGCRLCPIECGADRVNGWGACRAPLFPHVARSALHMWEEPPISGTHGSGTIFFSGCNLSCVFCQNHEISRSMVGEIVDAAGLCALMLNLEGAGAHNVNLVSPAPFLPVVREAIISARKEGLSIPIVYNTNSYEKVEELKRLEGLVEIYLPDLKYASLLIAKKYSGRADYFDYAAPAIAEMYRQVGSLELDCEGIACRGLIIRHLVLPGSVDESRRVLDHIADNYPKNISISLMSQYVPCHEAEKYPPLNRPLLKREYKRAVDYAISLGFTDILIQGMDSADGRFTPLFDGSVM